MKNNSKSFQQSLNNMTAVPLPGFHDTDLIDLRIFVDGNLRDSTKFHLTHKIAGQVPDSIIISISINRNTPSEIIFGKDNLTLYKIASTNNFGYKPKSNLKKPDAIGIPSVKNEQKLEKDNFISSEIINLAKSLALIDEKDIINTFSTKQFKFMVMSPVIEFVNVYYENINSLVDLQNVFSETYVYDYFYSDNYIIITSHGYTYPDTEEIFLNRKTSNFDNNSDIRIYSDGMVEIINDKDYYIKNKKSTNKGLKASKDKDINEV